MRESKRSRKYRKVKKAESKRAKERVTVKFTEVEFPPATADWGKVTYVIYPGGFVRIKE